MPFIILVESRTSLPMLMVICRSRHEGVSIASEGAWS